MAKSASQSFDSCLKQFREIIACASAKDYAPVYLLHGTEGYFIDKIERYITDNLLSDEEKIFNETILYGGDSNVKGGDVVLAARRYPMMGSRQLIVLREAQAMRSLDELIHYLESPLMSTVLVICHRNKSMDKRSALYKKFTAMKSAVIFESVAPRDYELSGFITGLFSQRGIKAEPATIEIIAENIGADLSRIDSELTKLLTRMGNDALSRAISPRDVEDNIGISKTFNVFELNRALSYGKFDVALRIATHLSKNPKESPLVVIISGMFTHFYRVAMLCFIRYEARRRGRAMMSELDQARAIKLPNAYFLREYSAAATGYGLSRAVAILGLLREWDMKSKGVGTGGSDEGELLRDLVLRISSI
ncbi:MAG: DNA polymerase III subunit delta [Rikenellaceae bacterium]